MRTMPFTFLKFLILLFVSIFLFSSCLNTDEEQYRVSATAKQAPDFKSLNKACIHDSTCLDGQICGDLGEWKDQCIIKPCHSSGIGEEHGCVAGSFCYIFDDGDGQYCTRICEGDADCGNPDLVCQETTSSSVYGIKICVRKRPW